MRPRHHPQSEAATSAVVLGNALSSLGQRDRALAVFGRGLEQARDVYARAQLRFNRAIVLQALGRQQDALADYTAVVRHPGENPSARKTAWSAGLGRATALLALGRDEAALDVLTPLLDVEPDDASNYDRAELRINLGMLEWKSDPAARDRARELVVEGLEIAKGVRNGGGLVELANAWLSEHAPAR